MKKYIFLFAAIVVLGAGAYYSELRFLSYSNSPAPTTAAAQGNAQESQGVTLTTTDATSTKPASINFTLSVGGQSYRGHVLAEATVLDAMSALASVGDFQFTSRDFPGIGAFIESINGKQAVDGYYWILYINGKQSDAGVSQTRVSSGDTIEWRYERNYWQ